MKQRDLIKKLEDAGFLFENMVGNMTYIEGAAT